VDNQRHRLCRFRRRRGGGGDGVVVVAVVDTSEQLVIGLLMST